DRRQTVGAAGELLAAPLPPALAAGPPPLAAGLVEPVQDVLLLFVVALAAAQLAARVFHLLGGLTQRLAGALAAQPRQLLERLLRLLLQLALPAGPGLELLLALLPVAAFSRLLDLPFQRLLLLLHLGDRLPLLP